MKLEDLKVGTRVWVLWIDAMGVSSSWAFIENIDKPQVLRQKMRQRSLGFVTRVTEEALLIHQSEMIKEWRGNDRSVDNVLGIPRRAIIRWGLLKEVNR